MKNKKSIGIIAAVLVIIIVKVLFSQKISANKLEKSLELGREYFETVDYDKALEAYQDALSINPKCYDAYLGAIDVYEKLNRPEEFQVFYEKSLNYLNTLVNEESQEDKEKIENVCSKLESVYAALTENNTETSETEDSKEVVEQENNTIEAAALDAETESTLQQEPVKSIDIPSDIVFTSESNVDGELIKVVFDLYFSHHCDDFDWHVPDFDNDIASLGDFIWWAFLGHGVDIGNSYDGHIYKVTEKEINQKMDLWFGRNFDLEGFKNYEVQDVYEHKIINYEGGSIYIGNMGFGGEGEITSYIVKNVNGETKVYLLYESIFDEMFNRLLEATLEYHDNEKGYCITRVRTCDTSKDSYLSIMNELSKYRRYKY